MVQTPADPPWRRKLKRGIWWAYVGLRRGIDPVAEFLAGLWKYRGHAAVVTLTIVVLVLFALAALIAHRMWRIPSWVLEGAGSAVEGAERVSTYRAAQAAVLGLVLQAAGGLALLAGLFFTWRGLVAAQEAQVTERFSRSVEHLANDRLEIRVGGVQGLERIARERDSEFLPILRLLSAFVMERFASVPRSRGAERLTLPLDLQIALAALSRMREKRRWGHGVTVDLRRIDLRGAELAGVDFEGFQLEEACFDGADLHDASFAIAQLGSVSFRGANLIGANLWSAFGADVDASGANLQRANLEKFTGSINFQGADLTNTNLEFAHIGGSDFRGATVDATRLYGTALTYCHIEGVDLRPTKGLPDDYAMHARRDVNTILPGRTLVEVNSEYSKRMGWS